MDRQGKRSVYCVVDGACVFVSGVYVELETGGMSVCMERVVCVCVCFHLW